MIKLIIWDWNGTLLNDVDYARQNINIVLKKYNLPQISIEKYRDVFTFPVKEYYRNIGFDFSKNPFEIVGMEFIELYNQKLFTCHLNEGVDEVLDFFKDKNIKQALISARQNESLFQDLKHFKIENYFDAVKGIEDNYASSKEFLVENYFKNSGFTPDEVLMIGDTTHDCNIAEKFGFKFCLYTQGHQSIKHFENCNLSFSIDNLKELIKAEL
jgi:phosphoglycolate phosphatase